MPAGACAGESRGRNQGPGASSDKKRGTRKRDYEEVPRRWKKNLEGMVSLKSSEKELWGREIDHCVLQPTHQVGGTGDLPQEHLGSGHGTEVRTEQSQWSEG